MTEYHESVNVFSLKALQLFITLDVKYLQHQLEDSRLLEYNGYVKLEIFPYGMNFNQHVYREFWRPPII